jgi:hypothetical protein
MAPWVIGVTRTDYGTLGCRRSRLPHWPLVTLTRTRSNQSERRHQTLIGEDADRRLLGRVELDTGR